MDLLKIKDKNGKDIWCPNVEAKYSVKIVLSEWLYFW